MSSQAYYSEGAASTAFYDVLTAADGSLAGDIDLYAGLVPPGGSVLELGSGTGRVAEALARRGFDVTGLELAPAMLDQAVARQPPGLRLRYMRGDMREFSFDRRFDAVICPFYALAHLPAGDAWRRVLENVAAHLEPNGLAAFHMPIDTKMAAPPPPPGSPVFRDGPLTVLMGGKTYEAAAGRMDLDLTYAVGPVAQTERLTLYSGNLGLFAQELGFLALNPPIPLGADGFVHVFRR
jgi:SAM-dependent methyltransferase